MKLERRNGAVMNWVVAAEEEVVGGKSRPRNFVGGDVEVSQKLTKKVTRSPLGFGSSRDYFPGGR